MPFFAGFSKGASKDAHPRWHAMAELLTGSREVECRGCEAFNKPPGLSRHTPAHQDNFYFCVEPADECVTMWVAMEDIDQTNVSSPRTCRAGSQHAFGGCFVSNAVWLSNSGQPLIPSRKPSTRDQGPSRQFDQRLFPDPCGSAITR